MAENTKIEWADHTFNPWVGCTKVGSGCDHCYAEGWAKRSGQVQWGPGAARRRTAEANWRKPIAWNAEAARQGGRYRVFCASLADVFDNEVPAEWRADLAELVLNTPNLYWLIVTKRIGNARKMLMVMFPHGIPDNVWLGITVVNQAEADRDIPKLLSTPAAVRFLSMEPLLGAVDLWDYLPDPYSGCPRASAPAVDWVIVGGESGPGARPMHPQWARDIRDQCYSSRVPFLFKQWGEWLPGENDMHWSGRRVAHHQDGRWGCTDATVNARNYVVWDDSGDIYRGSQVNAPSTLHVVAWSERVGKKAAGRLLDGHEHNAFPVR